MCIRDFLHGKTLYRPELNIRTGGEEQAVNLRGFRASMNRRFQGGIPDFMGNFSTLKSLNSVPALRGPCPFLHAELGCTSDSHIVVQIYIGN